MESKEAGSLFAHLEHEQKNQHAGLAERLGVTAPEWLPAEDWEAWIEHRKRIKAPMTKRAAELILRSLTNLRAAGHAPSAVLEKAIRRGWRDVFALSPGDDGYVPPAAQPAPAQPKSNRSTNFRPLES